jgi:hypothetical protein
MIFNIFPSLDLREDEQFHLNYPGALTISTKQVGMHSATFFSPHSVVLGVYSFVSNTILYGYIQVRLGLKF